MRELTGELITGEVWEGGRRHTAELERALEWSVEECVEVCVEGCIEWGERPAGAGDDSGVWYKGVAGEKGVTEEGKEGEEG